MATQAARWVRLLMASSIVSAPHSLFEGNHREGNDMIRTGIPGRAGRVADEELLVPCASKLPFHLAFPTGLADATYLISEVQKHGALCLAATHRDTRGRDNGFVREQGALLDPTMQRLKTDAVQAGRVDGYLLFVMESALLVCLFSILG
jgi:hypothetical protein